MSIAEASSHRISCCAPSAWSKRRDRSSGTRARLSSNSSGDDNRGEAVADEVYAGATHAHQLIDAKDDDDADGAEAGGKESCGSTAVPAVWRVGASPAQSERKTSNRRHSCWPHSQDGRGPNPGARLQRKLLRLPLGRAQCRSRCQRTFARLSSNSPTTARRQQWPDSCR